MCVWVEKIVAGSGRTRGRRRRGRPCVCVSAACDPTTADAASPAAPPAAGTKFFTLSLHPFPPLPLLSIVPASQPDDGQIYSLTVFYLTISLSWAVLRALCNLIV